MYLIKKKSAYREEQIKIAQRIVLDVNVLYNQTTC